MHGWISDDIRLDIKWYQIGYQMILDKISNDIRLDVR